MRFSLELSVKMNQIFGKRKYARTQTMKTNIIILTFNRNQELLRCITSIIASKNYSQVNVDVTISVFDNNPENDILKTVHNLMGREERIRLIYTRHTSNIGPRKNFIESIVRSNDSANGFDFHVYVSDDDYVLPEFIEKNAEAYLSGHDAWISGGFVLDEVCLGEYPYNTHRTRLVPTRPYKPGKKKIQFITDSRLLTGTAYTAKIVREFISSDKSAVAFAEELWYPMAFLSAFSQNPHFVTTPIFVHTQNNKTSWGEFDAYHEFFIGRVVMYEKMYAFGAISKEEQNLLIFDFVAHQSVPRIVKYLFLSKPPVSDLTSIFKLFMIRRLLLERVPRYLVATTRFLAHKCGYLRAY
jgi:glycosyltransferase involved in cell wall biosynthesis